MIYIIYVFCRHKSIYVYALATHFIIFQDGGIFMKKKGIKATNFWVHKAPYLSRKTAQEFINPKKVVRLNSANSECFGSCGADSGCASAGDCSGACST